MARQISISDTLTTHPSSYDSTNSVVNTSYTVSNPNNGNTDADSTTYMQAYLVTGSQAHTYVYYNFDTSDIPTNATIDSISCSAKCYLSNTNTSRISTREFQLCTGTTTKGSATTFTSSTSSATTMSNLGS